ncbi:hypothetical protein [Pseudomonas haemolytica]|jgi:hypothetical protein|uniref:Uncharacterized protein n=1 Tax=Pseudomonas haemolytica TaxID=2600065 RepID=A0ABS1H064_9PSED|nr:hypothetical protein [Pseudomonas haemolytica]MBK3462631.1 hypothetical protein [Pseudomonas haemolytica]
MNNNNELTEIYKTFMDVYKEAKVSGNQGVWAKSLLLLSMFNPTRNLQKYTVGESNDVANIEKANSLGLRSVEVSPNAVTIHIGEEELGGTPYKEFVFYGYQLNTDLHFVFCHDLVSKLQKTYEQQGSDLVVDFQLVMRDCNLDTKHTGFYKAAFIEVLDRMFYSSAKIVMKDGGEINDRFIYKRETKGDFIHIKFGDIFTDSVVKDTWSKKIDWKDKMALKSGTPRILFDKVEMFNAYGEARFSVKTMLKLCECSSKSLNEAIQYFKEIGYVKEVIDVRGGKTGKNIVEKTLIINKSFNLKQFAKNTLSVDKKAPALPETASASLLPKIENKEESSTIKKDTLLGTIDFRAETEISLAVKAYERKKSGLGLVEQKDMSDEEYRMDYDSIFTEPKALVKDADAWDSTCDFNNWVDESNKGN